MTRRRSLSRKQRVQIFDAAKGVCGVCKCKIQVGELWDADHHTPLALGGKDDIANMRPVHDRCHKRKSADDVRMIRKADRQRARHIGAKKPTSRPIPGSKASGIRKRLNGTVEKW